ncbi:DUF5693 family protein [Bacillus pinisoli]|uniref:DUF5693 family protein n=1 Tax=Bacillus pinisoli TaxID=2901866 RepID=UPI001FF3B75D|nr:DUF5693 family protein [Bacillus pinisoli]
MKKWLWIIVVLSIILTTPSILQRNKVELENNQYEIIIPYHEIMQLVDEGLQKDFVLDKLKGAGLTSISLEAETLELLEYFGHITILDRDSFQEALLTENFSFSSIPTTRGLYIHNNNQEYYDIAPVIKDIFQDVELINYNNQSYFFIPGNPEYIKRLPLGYSDQAIKEITLGGFNLVPRLPEGSKVNDENEILMKQLISMDSNLTAKFLPSGKQMVGYPDDLVKWGQLLGEKKNTLLLTEFNEQKGFTSYAYSMDLNVVRLHSLNMETSPPPQLVETAVRAVKERNIRALFIHIYFKDSAERNLSKSIAVLEMLTKNMPAQFELGKSEPHKLNTQSMLQVLFVLIGSFAFISISLLTLLNRKLALLGVSITLLIGLLTITGDLFTKILALELAIITAIIATIPSNNLISKRSMLANYFRSIGLAFIGIWFIVTLLYGTEYLLHIGAGFRGVKALYVFPMLFVLGYVIINQTQRLNFKQLVKWVAAPVKYWHLIAIGVLGITLLYYISRTGNAGSVSVYELLVRQKLEELLYVRPRTKEFLIGFPFFVLALYLLQTSRKIGLFFLIPGSIGWLSLVNTFTHLHIPLHISLLRSFYSLVLGYVIGLLFIFIYKLTVRYYLKLRTRW